MIRQAIAVFALSAWFAGTGPVVHAQDRFAVENLAAAPSQSTSLISLYGSRTLAPGALELGVFGSYGHRPLTVDDADGERLGTLVASVTTFQFMGAIGLASWADVGIALPTHLLRKGDSFSGSAQRYSLAESGFALGDLRLAPRVRFYRDGALGLAVVANLYLPTGYRDAYAGEPFRAEPRLVVDYLLTNGILLAGNLGYLARKQVRYALDEVDDQLVYGVGASVPVTTQVSIVSELAGAATVTAANGGGSPLSLELRAGVRATLGDLLLQGGAGGLLPGVGAPEFRIYASLGYAIGGRDDRDGDGVPDAADGCPDQAEDTDGIADQDGCPETDADGDGVPDERDGAPMEPEDADGHADDDGVPDPDNDGDGVPDTTDADPNAPEDVDGYQDQDGAPDPDNDGDGVLDAEDRCPLEPGSAAASGCPLADRDGDGVADADDRCPDQAGEAKAAGCPAAAVQPPPPPPPPPPKIDTTVRFDVSQEALPAAATSALDQVVAQLNAHPEVRVAVEGHTDSAGNAAANQALARRRAEAVAAYLEQGGVARGRIEVRAAGSGQPIANNGTAEGRRLNRRVEVKALAQGPRADGETR